jgi:hypothetical protein
MAKPVSASRPPTLLPYISYKTIRETRRLAFGPHCQCGYIIYEAEIDPEKLMIRHCSDCQTLSGSAFRPVV